MSLGALLLPGFGHLANNICPDIAIGSLWVGPTKPAIKLIFLFNKSGYQWTLWSAWSYPIAFHIRQRVDGGFDFSAVTCDHKSAYRCHPIIAL